MSYEFQQNYGCELQQPTSSISMPVFNKPKFMKQVLAKHHAKMKKSQNKSKNIKTQQTEQPKHQSFHLTDSYLGKTKLSKKVVQIDGNMIMGNWQNNQLHGYAIIDYEQGQHFEGNYCHGNRIEGTLQFKNGTQYSGMFFQNLFHGQGTLIDSNQRVIMCQWNKGKPDGKVKIKYPTGDIYYGQVRDLQKHGNGAKYVGEFSEGFITGQGVYYQDDGKVAEGHWKNGLLLPQIQNNEIIQESKGKTVLFKTGQQSNSGPIKPQLDQGQIEKQDRIEQKQSYKCSKPVRRHGFIDDQ